MEIVKYLITDWVVDKIMMAPEGIINLVGSVYFST